jgi:hypothetical protein
MTAPGAVLFARYAYAPNDLGYCGPAESAALLELGSSGHTNTDVVSIARRFSGAWPYAALLAELAGIADPLDEQVMRAYWTGGELLDAVDAAVFGVKLVELIGSQAGRYWGHLTPELLGEAAPTHGFHVFGVYPWTRLLAPLPEQALSVLDNCRIRWGVVLAVESEHVMVRSQRLVWDGAQLSLAAPAPERVRFDFGGRRFVLSPSEGDCVALHWDTVCEQLDAEQQQYLAQSTTWQLQVTNERLARQSTHALEAAR